MVTAADRRALVEVVVEQRLTGGWTNVVPEIPEDVPLPPTPGPLAVFSKRGPVVPMATITAPSGRQPGQVGFQHGAAAKVARRLGELPPGARLVQDHARRGLVVSLTEEVDAPALVDWVLAALAEVCIPPRTSRFSVFRFDP